MPKKFHFKITIEGEIDHIDEATTESFIDSNIFMSKRLYDRVKHYDMVVEMDAFDRVREGFE